MLLTPHHFQQWDNYHEELLNSRVEALAPYPWGVLGLRMNETAIAKGTCGVSQCRALMPDGLPVNIPETDAAPAARPVAELLGASGSLGVYLSIPAMRAGAPNFQANGGEPRAFDRYGQDAARVKDETTGDNEQQLSFARSNLRLMFDGEPREGYNSIKIAEIKRTPTGSIVYERNYIPPALDVAASPWLADQLKDLVDILTVKSVSLSGQRRERTDFLIDFTLSDVAPFWLLHTVNSFIPVLTHLLHSRPVHPERLYVELATLCGQLMTFARDRRPEEIVRYDHTDLYGTFSRLFPEIKSLIETVIPSRYEEIELEYVEDGAYYVGRGIDGRLLSNAEFYLAVYAKTPAKLLMDRVPELVKVASEDLIQRVIGGSVPGLMLEHVSPPPPDIRPLANHHYFNLAKADRLWGRIASAHNIAIFVPSELPGAQLVLGAVKPPPGAQSRPQ